MANADAHNEYGHVSVLLREVLDGLQPRDGGRYIDATLGGGGHTAAILERSAPTGQVLGIDADPDALAAAGERLKPFGERFRLAHGNFGELAEIARESGFELADGILMDLGVSSYQLDTAARGFSFQADGPLDMRLDPTQGETAADLVNSMPESELADIIFQYGEERASRRVARFLVEARRKQPFETTAQLANTVARALGGRHGKIHPATRTFQALRIAVNGELDNLERGLAQAIELLVPGGRLAVIAFHSLEDRIVKHVFRAEAQAEQPRLAIITRKPIEAEQDEARANPRSRSAKLRIAERV